MKKRNLLLAALCLSSVTMGAVGLTACNTKADHAHSWGDWTVTDANAPTETQTGKAIRACSGEGECDANLTDKEYTLPALTSADYTKTADTATCSAAGTVTYTYNKDGVNVSFTVSTPIDSTAHKYGEVYVKTAEGHYKVCEYNAEHTTTVEAHTLNGDGVCTVCGYETPAEEDEHEHIWSAWTVATQPTETAAGKATRVCSGEGECDATDADKEYTLPALTSADYTKTADTATCSAAGTVTYTYNKDGVNVSFTVELPIDSTAHKYGEEYVKTAEGHYKVCEYNAEHTTTVEAHTLNDDGVCTVCGYETPTEEDEHEHIWSAWTVVTQPTETAAGKATRACSGEGECDATDADKEYALPVLTSDDYTVETDKQATLYEAGSATYTYNKDGVSVSFTVEVPVLESDTYSVTVTAAEGATAEGITVKLGDYTADTDGNGVATIRTPKGEAEKYDVIISAQDFQTTDGLKKFYYKAATVSAEEPNVTVVLPTYLASTTLSPSTNTATAAITQDGLYFFDSSKTNVAFIQFINNTDVTKKYTITILDSNSEYVVDNSGDAAEYGNDPFCLYIMGIYKGENILTEESISVITSSTYTTTVIKVTSEDYEDGTVHTPIPVSLGEEITVTGTNTYYSIMTGDKFEFATTGAVQLKWYGYDINGEAYDVFGEYDLDPNLKYYFTASGEGTFTAERVYEEGIDQSHAIEITKDTSKQITVGTSGGITDNTRWVKFTSGETGYLTIASEQSLSYTLYNADGAQIGTNDTAIYPIEVTEGTVYYVKVLYKGEYDENFKTASFEVLLRDTNNADLGQVDPGESADDPYELSEALEADATHANLSSGTVEYKYGSMDNKDRYLKFTATADGVLTINPPSSMSTVYFYTDASFGEDYQLTSGTDYTEVNVYGEVTYTINLSKGDTVYFKITYITQPDLTLTATYTEKVPVDYTVVVSDSLGNKVEGISVSLTDAEGNTVGEAVATDAEGKAVFTVDPADYAVVITTEDYEYANQVTIKESLYDCTTEITLTQYVNYTITLQAEEGVELSDLTVTLKGTEISGTTDENGVVTFTEKVTLGVYEVEVEGFVVTGKTSADSAQATITVVPAAGVNKITATLAASAKKGENDGTNSTNAELLIGENEVTPLSSTVGYAWFKAAADGVYTFEVTDADLYIERLYLTSGETGTTTTLMTSSKNNLDANNIAYTTKEISEKEYVATVTFNLSAGDIIAISSGTKTATTHITITQN